MSGNSFSAFPDPSPSRGRSGSMDRPPEMKKWPEENVKTSECSEIHTDPDLLPQGETFDVKNKEQGETFDVKNKEQGETFDVKNKELHENRETKKKYEMLDAQRTRHENTLYEKGKEVALKLKDNGYDEETLKREFDLFWEQCVKEIIRDTPAIKDIDIMRDVRKILSDIYESVSVDLWRERRDIFSVSSFSDYVVFKKVTKSGTGGTQTLSREDEAQIRSFVSDVAEQTDRMIQSFDISKRGYNTSCIQLITDYIKTRQKHEERQVNYVFKNEFFMDLVLSIYKRANKMITDQHRLFREDNDPVIYLEKKREEYYSIFLKYCHGSASAAIFGEIICQKLKEPIKQSVYKKTARDLADEMRSNCESLNGNRSNLEKHILKTLAEEGDFHKYMKYLHNPRDHFKSFISDKVSRYITDQFSVSVLPRMKENIKLLQQKITRAAHQSTKHVQLNGGDAGLWLKSFTQQLSDELIFSENDLSGVKHDDVEDFNLLQDVINEELPDIVSDISSRFSSETFPVKLDYRFRPDDLLIDHFCQCCWVQCPFCQAICTNTTENHDGDHSVALHQVIGQNGWYHSKTKQFSLRICTSAVASDQSFHPNSSDDTVLWKEYRSAGGDYADWSIFPDRSELPYWKWFVCRFQTRLEKYYDKTFEGYGRIPDEWRKYSEQDALKSLDTFM